MQDRKPFFVGLGVGAILSLAVLFMSL